jgi:hypothetical protein
MFPVIDGHPVVPAPPDVSRREIFGKPGAKVRHEERETPLSVVIVREGGRSSRPRRQGWNGEAAAYWMPPPAPGMTGRKRGLLI